MAPMARNPSDLSAERGRYLSMDDPTAAYPIGRKVLSEEERAIAEEVQRGVAPEDEHTDPMPSSRGGIRPLYIFAALLAGAVAAVVTAVFIGALVLLL